MKSNKLVRSLHKHKKCYKIGISTISKENLHPESESNLESKEPWLKCRYIIAIMGFLMFCFLNGYRMNMSVSIVAMVNDSAFQKQAEFVSVSCPIPIVNVTEKNTSEHEYDTNAERFDWSPRLQGYIQGGYYLSYVIVQVPVGKLVERHGCKWFFFSGTLLAALATLAVPLASGLHAYAVILMQVLRGVGQGVYQPAGSLLTANWFPKMERGLLYTIMQSGAALGAFVGSILSGLLCKSVLFGGWPSSFHAFGIAGLILSAALLYFLHESPSVHPRISQAELVYITSNQEMHLAKRRPVPPWSKIFTSVPVYALAIGYFGQFWAISQFLVSHSTFLGTILHFPIEQNGILSAIPFLLMFLFSQVTSWGSSFLTTRKYASIDHVRKGCNFLACLGFSASLLGVYLSGCNRALSSLFSFTSVGFTGFGFSGVWIVSADMSPTFAASVNAICCTFGCLPSFILPLVVGYITDEQQTLEQWNKVFFIGMGIVMASGFIFAFFGSAEIQPWNYVEEDQKQENDKNERF